jgi:phage repressor protein C with HTH and peptisase S24 domain
MLTHEGVWAAIDRHAKRFGMTPSGLARRAGLDPTTFNKSKRFAADGRPRWPSTESIAKVLQATRSDLRTLFSEVIGDAGSFRREVPVIGTAHAGLDDASGKAGFIAAAPTEMITFPGNDEEPVYALKVEGRSMLPVYRDGDVLFISPSAPVRGGDRVVLKTKSGEVFVKVLKRRTTRRMELHAVNPEHPDVAIPLKDVDWTARIVWASQ